ncbi:MAG: hypothetical protein P4M11_15175 [Candidatus Pacebacteria bacterium]|nr:hypothetical protein [Candidatus Paceibacterota bacterium]
MLKDIVETSKLAEIEHMLFDNICDRVTYFSTEADCAAFANGAAAQGLSTLISAFLTDMRAVAETDGSSTTDATKKRELLNNQMLYEACMSRGEEMM